MLQLAADDPQGARTRLLLLATLERMVDSRPDVIREVLDRVVALQRRFPLPGRLQASADAALARLGESVRAG